MIPSVLIVIAMLAVVAILSRYMTRWETACAFASCGLHICFAWVQVWLHTRFYNGVGDMFGYLDAGGAMAHLMNVDFSRFGWETLKLFLHVNSRGAAVESGMTSTQSMEAATAFILFVVGDSMLAACLTVGALATLGQLVLYLSLRREIPERSRRGIVVALMLVPSVLFWSSAVTKEGLTLFFFALMAAGALVSSRRRWIVGGAICVVGTVGVAMLKPYILFPFVLASVSWIYVASVRRTGARFRARHVIAAAAISLLGLAAVGTIFPEFSLSQLAREAARQQQIGAEVGGGSYIQVGDAEARSFWQQLPYIPLAFADSMFRPLIIEVHNAPMLGAAIETTALTILSIYLIVRLRLRRAVDALQKSPLLAFCTVFTFSFAIAVGLATTNLGTLSRYRMPMMPYYSIALLLLYAEMRAADVRHRPSGRARALVPQRQAADRTRSARA